ncbi:MAG: hypothetical protein K6B46_05560, partial [Opitutales bacterium]|nr:hypothetical protein [Opitutales bacterium]
FVKNNGRWEACWDFPLETSQFRFYSVVIQPCARLRFRIRRSPVNGVYTEDWPENRLKKMENADFKIIYDMERFFPEKGNSNEYLESNVFKMMPRKKK